MSKRIDIGIFERFTEPLDKWTGEVGSWQEVAREWVGLTPQRIDTQRTEFVDAAQNKSTRKTVADCTWTPTTAAIDTACRMRVGERIFEIESILNVGENNRELQMMVIEKT